MNNTEQTKEAAGCGNCSGMCCGGGCGCGASSSAKATEDKNEGPKE